MSGERTVVGSCPLDCPDACSWVITVDETGTATKIRGNADHPFARGELCKKVNPWLDYAADPGRLLQPRRRVGPKGAGRFVEVTWDDALSEMAERFGSIIDTTGPAAIWPFAGTGNVGFVQGGAGPTGARLWNHLGVSGHEITICSTSGHHGLGYTLGMAATLDPEDVVDAGLILVWASNTMVTNRHLWPFVTAARRSGAPLVVVDPVRTRTAANADVHLAPRPGSDAALAMGLMRAVVDAGGVDEEFVTRRCVGWEEFRASLEQWTPARVGRECGLDEGAVAATAELIVENAPLAVKLGQGVQRHANGGQAARVVSCLPAVTGAYNRPGGGLFYSTMGHYGLNLEGLADDRPRTLAMTNLAANLTDLHDPPVEAILISGANPVVSNPDTDAVRRSLSRDDLFTVVIELFETETTAYADLVLPSTMQHEQYELNDSFSHLYLNWNEPAVAAPGGCLSHTEIFRRLAKAMDLDEPSLFADDLELAAALLDTPRFADAGITVDKLRAQGWARLPGTEAPFAPVAERFPTPSGRFEFASDRAAVDGHGRLPAVAAVSETAMSETAMSETAMSETAMSETVASEAAGSAGRRYVLLATAGEWHINSTFAGSATTARRTGQPTVRVNPADADRDGLVDGAMVEVGNARGSFTAELSVSDVVRCGVAWTTKGWWLTGVNATVAERDSDMGRGAVFHDNEVTIDLIS